MSGAERRVKALSVFWVPLLFGNTVVSRLRTIGIISRGENMSAGIVFGCDLPIQHEGCVRCPVCKKHYPGAAQQERPTCTNSWCINDGKSLYPRFHLKDEPTETGA